MTMASIVRQTEKGALARVKRGHSCQYVTVTGETCKPCDAQGNYAPWSTGSMPHWVRDSAMNAVKRGEL